MLWSDIVVIMCQLGCPVCSLAWDAVLRVCPSMAMSKLPGLPAPRVGHDYLCRRFPQSRNRTGLATAAR